VRSRAASIYLTIGLSFKTWNRSCQQVDFAKGRSDMRSTNPAHTSKFVMPGLVPGIHVLLLYQQERRGWPGQSPAMTQKTNCPLWERPPTRSAWRG
jgi:hypothetical protein